MTGFVQQRSAHDCAIASLAMLSGRPYEDVLEAVGDCYDPERGMRRQDQALERLGFDHSYENGEAVGDFVMLHRPFCLSAEYFRLMAWGRRALISTPSLNNPDSSHMVYWDGRKLHDPNPPERKRYQSFEELAPSEIVLFREEGR